ncbi:hypothetical protein SmJEL517_g00091 [Synchytrium microbalum]|uniref:MoaB/Mog domain-containing protein n=1 Tax=Synchytrium microbalum TaxID=1806994 RepID=A0A507CB61_9FUNG|nr:uncharacterized protein SmJEL517_g00091 [Synchytrium microbalum]TPX38297.1 hypothetical protein SmJEL517_g00091 [Synchytrium microbalum]
MIRSSSSRLRAILSQIAAPSTSIQVAGVKTNRMSSSNVSNTVACLIIGDEARSYFFALKMIEQLSAVSHHYLAQKCFEHGLELRRIVVVPDIEEEIIESVRILSSKFGLVFTSGGIGPTHDDITYESMAKAFNLQLEYHQETLEKMNTVGLQTLKAAQEDAEKAGKPVIKRPEPTAEMLEARKRMALLPLGKDCDYVYAAPHLWVPIVRCNKNVHILPGVPRLFQTLLDNFFINHLLPTIDTVPWTRKLVGTSLFESDIAPTLTDVQNKVKPLGISIGSYPKMRPVDAPIEEWKVRVVVSVIGKDSKAVHEWAEVLRSKVQGFDVDSEERAIN